MFSFFPNDVRFERLVMTLVAFRRALPSSSSVRLTLLDLKGLRLVIVERCGSFFHILVRRSLVPAYGISNFQSFFLASFLSVFNWNESKWRWLKGGRIYSLCEGSDYFISIVVWSRLSCTCALTSFVGSFRSVWHSWWTENGYKSMEAGVCCGW